MFLRFFNDFDDFFGDRDVTFSLLPLRMTEQNQSQPDLCKSKGKCTRPLGLTSSGFATAHRLASLDVAESENECIVHVDLPGITKEDVQVHFDESNRLLTVEAERKAEFKEEDAKQNFFHHERYFGRVQRSVTLPENVDGQSVKASMDNGVLKLIFGKKPEKETRQRIEIN